MTMSASVGMGGVPILHPSGYSSCIGLDSEFDQDNSNLLLHILWKVSTVLQLRGESGTVFF